MNDTSELQRLFQRLAAASPGQADAATEQRVLAAFRARHRRHAWRIAGPALAAAALVIVLILMRGHLHPPVTASAHEAASLPSGFMLLPYAQSGVPLEQAVIVRVKLQPSAWSALNPALPPPGTNATINADLLIGQDGIARAVRLVSIQ